MISGIPLETVLVVDDDLPMQKVLQRMLLDDGYGCHTASDGLEAQEIIQSKQDVLSTVVLDWMMPRMTGIELLRWMKDQPQIEHIPVIMLTAMDQPSRIREGIEAGAFYYLTKPFQRPLLRSIVRAAVSDTHCRRRLMQKLRECENPLAFLQEGTFRFRTLADADLLAARIASATPDPDHSVVIGELLTNAVEHGNLGIGYEEKTRLVDQNTWEKEVDRRLALPENAQKYVHVRMKKEPQKLLIEIEDHGSGFDHQRWTKIDEARIFDNHGRGIAIAMASLNVEFLGVGNKVAVTIPLQ